MRSRWHLLVPVVALLALGGCATGIAGQAQPGEIPASLSFDPEQWVPSRENRDPSTAIEGIYIAEAVDSGDAFTYPAYQGAIHIDSPQRVAYDRFPPIGGPHDTRWADCNGPVYPKPVRDETMVHTLEHGSVWIAYQPELVSPADLATLTALVADQPYLTLTPYPTLESPISLQSWGHQLTVDSADDVRILQFVTALVRNPYTFPEVGATCDQTAFDIENPPAFDGSPRDATALPLDGGF